LKLNDLKKENMHESEKQAPTWEILALIIGFVGSANYVPELVNLVLNLYPKMQDATRSFKLICVGGYFIFLVVLASRHLYRFHIQHGENKETDEEKFKRTLRRLTIINFFRQFPLSVFNYFIFKFYKLWSYDLFKRSPEWGERPDLFKQVGRFRVEDKTVELQFPKNFESLYVRETNKGSDKFSETQNVKWTAFPYRLLSLTSWFGLGWTLSHLNVQLRIFSRFLVVIAICYSIGFILQILDILNIRLHYSEMDNVWKAWIIFLVIFDFLAALGIFLKKRWGELFFFVVAVSQIIAYTQFQNIFQDQTFLVQFHIACLGIYAFLKALDVWRIREIKNQHR